MPRVLMAGLPASLAPWLGRRLGAAVAATSNGRDTLDELDRNGVALLILDHNVIGPPALEVLRQARASSHLEHLEVLYCLDDEGASRNLPRKLVTELGVAEVLFHPVDPAELARRAASILGVALAPPGDEPHIEPAGPSPDPLLARQLAGLWDRSSAATLERLELLDEAGGDLLEGKLSPERRAQAERAAHKLVGSLGMFGFERASRFARQIEHLLQQGARMNETQALRFSELVVALRLELEHQPALGQAARVGVPEPRALVVTADPDLAERLTEAAAARGLALQSVSHLASARQSLSQTSPAVVLLDLSNPARHEEALGFVSELGGRTPPVPVVVLTAQDTFTDRVEVARRGGLGFLPKSLSASEVVEAVARMLERRNGSKPRVLAVDDDPAVLATLEALLEPRGARVTGLGDPLRFWETLEPSAPDLIVLDVEMPHLGGIELCRVLRNDPRWSSVPVIVLTAHQDAATVDRVFAAGADDFVAKPMAGAELVTRVFNRLERTRLLRQASGTDALTGLVNRRRARRALEDFLRLAGQHGQPFSLALLHADRLKEINREHGHAAGDEVLRRLGRLLERTFRSQDVAARWAGDEFVVGMYGLGRGDGVRRLAEMLEALRDETFRSTAAAEFHATFSAGVAQYPDDASDFGSLYRAADEARQNAEAAGGDRVLAAGWSPEQKEQLHQMDVVLALADEAQAALLRHALETRGYRVRELGDGKAAARLLAGPTPRWRARVLVLDVELPGLDGLSLLGQLASEGLLERSRAIVLTSPLAADEAAAAVGLGAFDHVAKPFSLPVLVNRIRRALES